MIAKKKLDLLLEGVDYQSKVFPLSQRRIIIYLDAPVFGAPASIMMIKAFERNSRYPLVFPAHFLGPIFCNLLVSAEMGAISSWMLSIVHADSFVNLTQESVGKDSIHARITIKGLIRMTFILMKLVQRPRSLVRKRRKHDRPNPKKRTGIGS